MMKVLFNTLVAGIVTLAGGCAALGQFIPLDDPELGSYAPVTAEARSFAQFISAVMYERQGRNDLEVEALNRVANSSSESKSSSIP